MATNNKQVNLAENPGVIRVLKEERLAEPLPADMLSDLHDSFEFFAKGGSHISSTDLESIVHNFGFNRIS